MTLTKPQIRALGTPAAAMRRRFDESVSQTNPSVHIPELLKAHRTATLICTFSVILRSPRHHGGRRGKVDISG